MATAIEPLDKIQIGLESTKGTLVAATRLLRVRGTIGEEQEYYRSNYPEGYRANTGGAGTIIRKGSAIEYETDLTAEEILWPLSTGIKGGVTPTGGGADKTWLWTPELTTAIVTLDSATLECVRSDGSTNHYYAEAGYGLTESFKIDWAFNQPAKMSVKMFARARQTGTPTAALVPYTTREILASNLLGVYLDTTWAGLGGTQLTVVMREVHYECTTGLNPDYTMDARADVDFTQHNVGRLTATLSLVMELNATGSARYTNFRNNDIVFIRLKNTGSLISAANKTVQIDGAYRFVGNPQERTDNDVRLVTFNLESVKDDTSNKTQEFTAINALAAI